MDINVRALGAVGDDSIDDTDAIKRAIEAAGFRPETRTAANATVYFPAGTYRISDSIISFDDAPSDWRMNLRLVGDGPRQTIIRNVSPDKPTIKMQSTLAGAHQVRGLYIADLSFRGITQSTSNEYPIITTQVTELQLHRVLFSDLRRGAMKLTASGDCAFSEVVCDLCGDGGFSYAIIHLISCGGMWFSDCMFNNCLGSSGLLIESGRNIILQNSDIAGFGVSSGGVQVKLGLGTNEPPPFPSPTAPDPLVGFTLRGCVMELGAPNTTQILIGAADDTLTHAKASGVRIENVLFAGNNGLSLNGVVFQNCDEVSVSDCIFGGMANTGVVIFKIQGTPNKTGIRIGRQLWIAPIPRPEHAKYLDIDVHYKGDYPFGAPTFVDENNTLELGRISIGRGATIKRHYHTAVLLDFPSIAPQSTSELRVVIADVPATGTVASASPQQGIDPGLVWCTYVLGSDTVVIRLGNITSLPIDPPTQIWNVHVWEY